VSSDEFAVRELWFSPPAFGADLGLGAVSMGDALRLTLRSVPGLFSDAAATEFATVIGTELDALCEA
jgi:hypothetical protein